MQRRLITVLERTPYGIKYFAKRDKVAIARGKTEGIAEGITEGIAKGKAEGIAEGIIRVLTRRFNSMPKKLQRQIMEIKDIDKLDELIGIAATCVSIDEFADTFN
jgi:flagellar biosynthesis/type III secretory pathway protein FliH